MQRAARVMLKWTARELASFDEPIRLYIFTVQRLRMSSQARSAPKRMSVP